ncbi:MAG TPA: NAD(P)/FAD-dependent oxidoreductase [Acidimicrobiales bacterium]|nr:NAD(P)/FAD-dependent oxidoreductase [Acidimicrobiales bacterium]
MTWRVAVVGGGIGGAAAARRLAGDGAEVTLLERSPTLGGLVVSFAVGGTPLECFYHHVFPHEHHVIGLIDELGLGADLDWHATNMGVFVDGKPWPFTSPLDLLRFRPLPFVDRLRTGVGALRLGRVKDWQALDDVAARDWLTAYTSPRAGTLVWDPLLRAKFGSAAPAVPAAWMWGRFQQRAAARSAGREKLGYLRGGFRRLFDALDTDLRARGVDVRLGCAVESIVVEGTRVVGVRVSGETLAFDHVVFAGTLNGLASLVPAQHHDARWTAIDALGVQCVVLELARPLTDAYWTNVCDARLPFGGIIEHTNMIPAADYGGRHVVYLSRYFTAEEPLAHADPAQETQRWIDALAATFPGFDRRDVLAAHPFKTPYAAPVVTRGYASKIPPAATHLDGLTISTTAQIYPQDRGMSEAIRTGLVAAGIARARAHAPRPA